MIFKEICNKMFPQNPLKNGILKIMTVGRSQRNLKIPLIFMMKEVNKSRRELSSLRRHENEDFSKILLFIFLIYLILKMVVKLKNMINISQLLFLLLLLFIINR